MANKTPVIDEPAEAARARLTALAEQQGVQPLQTGGLRADFWPEEEKTDDFLAWLYRTRQESAHRGIPE